MIDRAHSLGLSRITLRFHYRSRERSLITPSNLISYGMKLRTVPTPDLDTSNGLRVAFLSGTTNRTSLGAENHAEANAVVDLVKEHATAGNRQSIGVITSNYAQRDLIKRELAQRLSEEEIARLTPVDREPLLIRSATECQGEERDVIIVSTVYDRASKRLGLFERPNAVSILNVMLSRARRSMTVVTSYRPSSENEETPQIPGRAMMDTMFLTIDAATTTETRQASPAAFKSLAQKLNMPMDHLGVVIGMRRPTDRSYRIGIIPITDQRGEEDWTMIERQLTAVGWKTIRLSETDCRRAPSETIARIRARMAE